MNDHLRRERSRWTAILVGILVAMMAMFVIVWFTLARGPAAASEFVSRSPIDTQTDGEVHVARSELDDSAAKATLSDIEDPRRESLTGALERKPEAEKLLGDSREFAASFPSRYEVIVRLLAPDGNPLRKWLDARPELDSNLHFTVVDSDSAKPNGFSWRKQRTSNGPDEFEGTPRSMSSTFEIKARLRRLLPRYIIVCLDDEVVASRQVNHVGEVLELIVPPEYLTRRRRSVRLVTLDAVTRAPIAGARIALSSVGVFRSANHETLRDGTLRFEVEDVGPQSLTIIARGYGWIQEAVTIGSSGETDLGTFRLTSAVSIFGRVVDASGPLARVDVFAIPLEHFEAARVMRASFPYPSKGDGLFSIPALGRGKQLLRVADAVWCARPIIVDTTGGDAHDVVMQVTRGVDVRFTFDEPAFGSLLRIVDAEDLPVLERKLNGKPDASIRLAPGAYAWQIEADTTKTASRKFFVPNHDVEVHVAR